MAAGSTKTISANPTNPVDSAKLHVYYVLMNSTVLTSAIYPPCWVTSKGTLCRIINFKNKYNYLLKAPCYLKCEILMGCDNLGVSTVLRIRNRGKHMATFLLWSPFLLRGPCAEGSNLQSKCPEKRDILLHLERFKR